MFLKRIKRKSAQKYLSKQLQVVRVLDQSKIKTIGVLVDARVFQSFPYVSELTQVLNISEENVSIIYYHPDKKIAEAFTELVYTDSDLKFKAELNNTASNSFIIKEFDALLNFYNTDDLLLNLVAIKSKAKYKIGFAGAPEGINDLCVVTELSNIKTFTFELQKYLSILKKI